MSDALTHYIGTGRSGLCGAPDIELDLRPYDGEISCEKCLALWSQGYSLCRLPPAEVVAEVYALEGTETS